MIFTEANTIFWCGSAKTATVSETVAVGWDAANPTATVSETVAVS